MAEVKVKEDLSRMKGAYGEKMIKKLKNMKVAVFGLRGAGIETAKNLLLAGPHTVMVSKDHTIRTPPNTTKNTAASQYPFRLVC